MRRLYCRAPLTAIARGITNVACASPIQHRPDAIPCLYWFPKWLAWKRSAASARRGSACRKRVQTRGGRGIAVLKTVSSRSPASCPCRQRCQLRNLSTGELLGVAGESGSGKSVTMSLMNLLPTPLAEIVQTVISKATCAPCSLRSISSALRGGEIGFVFQDPMTSLNPVFTVGFS